MGASLSPPQLSLPLSHRLPPSPPLARSTRLASCDWRRLVEQQKVAACKWAQTRANWYTADRLKSKCLTFPLLDWHTVIANKCPPTHTQTHTRPLCACGCVCVGGVCPIFLVFFFFFFLISPRAFKIWPGQMGKGVWPTLMDSTPIKRMSELSKARGPRVRACVWPCVCCSCLCVCVCVCERGTEGIERLSIFVPAVCTCYCKACAQWAVMFRSLQECVVMQPKDK